jgi:multidrug resistance efflux pump
MKTSVQLQREIDEALAKHKQSRAKWLSMQAGPRQRERQVAYDEMTALAREANALEKRGHSTKKSTASASAGFAIHTDDQGVIENNARDRFGPNYGDLKDRVKMMKAGFNRC